MIGSFFVVIRLFFGEDIIGIQLLTVFVGGDARFFVKLFDEQRGVGESAQIADLGDGLLGGGDQLFCVFQSFGQNVLLGGEPQRLFKDVTEAVIGIICHLHQLFRGDVGEEVFIDIIDCLGEKVLMRSGPPC